MRVPLAAFLALACGAACAPMVTHGPRVEPGFATTLTLGGGYAPCDTLVCDLELLPQGALGFRVGRAAGETRPGFSAGINLSASLLSSDLDFYVQAPAAAAPLDAGGGVLVSLAHTMPYVQAGRMREDGSGWYTTQGFVWMARRPATYDLFNVSAPDEPAELRPRYWAPSLAYRARGRRAAHVYVSGAFDTADEYEYPPNGGHETQRVGSQPVRVLMVGAVVEGSLLDLLPIFFPFP